MLNICIPTSRADIGILPHTVASLVRFGGLEGHKITVFPAPSVADEAAHITEPLVGLVPQGNFKVSVIDIEPDGGWPLAPNQHFVAVVNKLMQMGSQDPWMWFEPDCTVTQFGWADAYMTEYNTSRRPYAGFLRNTSEVIKGEQGKHLVAGGAIFPADFYTRFNWWTAAASRADLPFDIFLRWELLGPGVNHPRCHETKLVQHCPRSKSFHRNGKVIEGVPEAPGPNLVVTPEAMIVHGCKDGSLSRLVCGKEDIVPPANLVEEYHKIRQEELLKQVESQIENRDPALYGKSHQAPGLQAGWKQTLELPEAPAQLQESQLYKAIWDVIKNWSILVPGNTFATSAAKPGHVAMIVEALAAIPDEEPQLDVQPDLAAKVEPVVGVPTIPYKNKGGRPKKLVLAH